MRILRDIVLEVDPRPSQSFREARVRQKSPRYQAGVSYFGYIGQPQATCDVSLLATLTWYLIHFPEMASVSKYTMFSFIYELWAESVTV